MRLSVPYMLYVLAFGVAPFIATFIIVGFDYHSALLALSLVPVKEIFANTIVMAVMNSVLGVILGTLAAVAIDMLSVRYQRPLTLATVLPHTVPFVSAALIWSISLYGGGWGWFTYLLHISYDPLYLARTAIWGVILVSVWGSMTFPFIIVYASLRAMPRELRETAEMDKIGLARYYGEVAIPMVSKAILISFVIELAFSMGMFDAPYVLTGGGPGYSTTTLGILVYNAVFSLGSYSAGALIAAAIAALATVPAIVLFLLLRANRPLLPSVRLRIPDLVFKVIMLVILSGIIFFSIMPIYWMFLVAFRPDVLDFHRPPIMLPVKLTAEYFIRALYGSVPYMVSSLVVSIGVALIAVYLSSPAAFEVARGRAPRWLLPLSIYLYVLPPMAFIIPIYLMFAKTHLLNTWWALIASMPLFSTTFALWIMSGYFLDLPKSYDEVADLFGIRRKFTRLIMPLSRPVLMATFILTAVATWHALFYPLVLTSTPYSFSFPPYGAQTVTIYALTPIQESSIDWGMLASIALVTSLPPMIIDVLFLSMIARGGPSGGLKFIV